MKISIIGAGNVGGFTTLRLSELNIAQDLVLVDVANGIAQGKVFDLDDAKALVKLDYNIKGASDIEAIKDSNIVVVTAGFARKPGITREDLFNKNAAVIKDVALNIKKLAADAIVIIVTNPLDLMTLLALRVTGFSSTKVFGMGVSLDASRFANLISKELSVSAVNIEASVIGSHGEGMMPLPRFTRIKGVNLDEYLDDKKVGELTARTIDRGREIVSLLGSGSAYVAPSAAITEIVKAIVKDEKRVIGVSAYLNGEYGIKDVCVGVPCRIGKSGVEQVIELELNNGEKQSFEFCVLKLKEQFNQIKML